MKKIKTVVMCALGLLANSSACALPPRIMTVFLRTIHSSKVSLRSTDYVDVYSSHDKALRKLKGQLLDIVRRNKEETALELKSLRNQIERLEDKQMNITHRHNIGAREIEPKIK